MKVLLIDVNCGNSSTGKIVYDLYSRLNEHGDEAAVCYGRGARIREKNIYKFGLDWETVLHAGLTRLTGYTGCFSFFSTKRLLAFIRRFQPDVVHIHELHAYFVNLKPLLEYLKQHKIKTVLTLHCEFDYTGKCGHSFECENWKTQCHDCPHLREYPSVLWFDRTGKMFRQKKELFSGFENLQITAPSEWLADRIQQSFLKEYPVTVVHNGVDTDIFHPVDPEELRIKYGIGEEERVVLALAPHLMSEEKGGKIVLRLAEKLAGEQIRFILVGIDGINGEKTEKNTVQVGPVYDKKLLAKFYSLADAFVICSEKEVFPTTCLEAQACGTPVYGFSAGGVEETLIGGRESVVQYGDIEAMEKLLVNLRKKNRAEAFRLSEKAAGYYSVETEIRQYRHIYLA